MIGMTFVHRCDVQRYSTSAEGYGEKRTPVAHISGVHFRLKTETQRAFNSLTGQWMVSTRYRGLFPFDTDAIAGDRITNVVDEYGDAVAGNWEVKGVMPRRGHAGRHKSLELEKVS